MQHEYEVLRLIEEKGNCHVCMDYVMGELLAEYIARKKSIEKDVFLKWMLQLIKELGKVERARALEAYCVISPFHLIMKMDGSIALVNAYAKVNLKKMQNYSLEKVFPLFSRGDTQEALYAFGKTMQYILAHTQLVPILKRSEERTLRKIILSCLKTNQKRKYRNFNQIEYKISNMMKIKRRIRIPKSFCALAGFLVGVCSCVGIAKYNPQLGADDYKMLGIFYMGFLEEYEESILHFSKMKQTDEKEYWILLAEFMNGAPSVTERDVEQTMQILRDYNTLEERYCFLKICSRLDSARSRTWIIEDAEQLLAEEPVWLNEADVRELLAHIYQQEVEAE